MPCRSRIDISPSISNWIELWTIRSIIASATVPFPSFWGHPCGSIWERNIDLSLYLISTISRTSAACSGEISIKSHSSRISRSTLKSSWYFCGKNRHFDIALPSVHPVIPEGAHTSLYGVGGKRICQKLVRYSFCRLSWTFDDNVVCLANVIAAGQFQNAHLL